MNSIIELCSRRRWSRKGFWQSGNRLVRGAYLLVSVTPWDMYSGCNTVTIYLVILPWNVSHWWRSYSQLSIHAFIHHLVSWKSINVLTSFVSSNQIHFEYINNLKPSWLLRVIVANMWMISLESTILSR